MREIAPVVTTSSRPSVTEADGARRMPPPYMPVLATATDHPESERGNPSTEQVKLSGFQAKMVASEPYRQTSWPNGRREDSTRSWTSESNPIDAIPMKATSPA